MKDRLSEYKRQPFASLTTAFGIAKDRRLHP